MNETLQVIDLGDVMTETKQGHTNGKCDSLSCGALSHTL